MYGTVNLVTTGAARAAQCVMTDVTPDVKIFNIATYVLMKSVTTVMIITQLVTCVRIMLCSMETLVYATLDITGTYLQNHVNLATQSANFVSKLMNVLNVSTKTASYAPQSIPKPVFSA